MKRLVSFTALVSVLCPLAQAQTILTLDMEGVVGTDFSLGGFTYGDASATQTIEAGSGVGGSKAAKLDADLRAVNPNFGGAGLTVGRFQTTPLSSFTDPNLLRVTYSVRSGAPTQNFRLVIQAFSWTGSAHNLVDELFFDTAATDAYTTNTVAYSAFSRQTGTGFKMDADAMQAMFILDGGNGLGQRTLLVDNVQFEAIPEPATLAILALGATAFARRKNRR